MVIIICDPSNIFSPGAQLTTSGLDGLILNEINDPKGAALPLGFAVEWPDGHIVIRFPGGMRRDDGLWRWPIGRRACEWIAGIAPLCQRCGKALYPVGRHHNGICWRCEKKEIIR